VSSIEYAAAVDIGGTKIAVAIGTADGQVLARHQNQTPVNPEEGVAWIGKILQKWKSEDAYGRGILQAVGVGCPGPLDRNLGIILKAPNLGSWNRYPLGQSLHDLLGIPVYMENDANMAAIGEYHYGSGVGCQDMVYVTVSTGIGGGVIVNNQLVRGVDDSAGEIGHMTIDPQGALCNCGNHGCLEAMASGTAIVRLARERMDAGIGSAKLEALLQKGNKLSAKGIAEAAGKGDKVAASIIEEAMINLGIGIGNLITVLSPERVVIGGGVAKIGEVMFATINREIRKRVKLVPVDKIRVIPAKLGDDSVLCGGLYLAFNRGRGNISSEE